jgi:hypothetical protein
MLFSGRARFRTRPVATGSLSVAKIIGTVGLSCRTAFAAGVLVTTITSGAKATNAITPSRIRWCRPYHSEARSVGCALRPNPD